VRPSLPFTGLLVAGCMSATIQAPVDALDGDGAEVASVVPPK
jgi:hypothetical protein